MNRYQSMFARLALKKEGALIPFVMLLDPNFEQSKKIIETLIKEGADALELGIAFSDPVADGPTIQKAALRVLANRSHVQDAFDLVRDIRKNYSDIPIGILTYANLVVKKSMSKFYAEAKKSGVDSVLVADVPLIEASVFCDQARKHAIAPVLIAPPNMPKNKVAMLSKLAEGYTYVVTRSGVTGADEEANWVPKDLIAELKRCFAPPLVFGFGISSPKHLHLALSQGADGVICGSQLVKIIEDNLNDNEKMLNDLGNFTRLMKGASVVK